MKDGTKFFGLVALGAVMGSVLNGLLSAAGLPGWLVNALPVGIEPFTLDLIFCQLTFGFTLSLSFGSIAGMITALVLLRRKL